MKTNDQQNEIDRAGLIQSLRDLRSVLWPWTLYLLGTVVVFALVPMVVNWKAVAWTGNNVTEALSFVATAVQGTIGVAATIAGAAATVFLSRMALKLAERTVEIAKAEERRESDVYAREIKIELASYSRDFTRAFTSLIDAFSYTRFRVPVEEIFLARFLVREQIMKESGGIRTVMEEYEQVEGYFEEEVRQVIALLEKAAEHCSIDVDGASSTDEQHREQYREAASFLRQRMQAQTGHAVSFSAAAGLTPELSALRRNLVEALQQFESVLSRIDTEGYVSDLIMSHHGGEASLMWWRERLAAVQKAINEDDDFLDRAGRAIVTTGLGFQSADLWSEANKLNLERTLSLATLSAFMGLPTYRDPANVFQQILPIASATSHLARIAAALCAEKEDLVKVFALGVAIDGLEMPRSLMSYRPSEATNDTHSSLRWAADVFCQNERHFADESGVCADNPVHRYEECLDFWKSLANKRLFKTDDRID